MRFDTPSQFLTRRTTSAVTLGGQTIQKDQVIFAMLAAANRDGRQFKGADGQPNPTVFDILRPRQQKHLGFGVGRHFCLGGPLAEQVSAMAISRFLSLFPEYHIPIPYDRLPWKNHSNLRCLEHVPVRLKA